VVGSRTRTAIALAHRAQVEIVDYFHHEARQVSYSKSDKLLVPPTIPRRRSGSHNDRIGGPPFQRRAQLVQQRLPINVPSIGAARPILSSFARCMSGEACRTRPEVTTCRITVGVSAGWWINP
jgi:hypothetical protein